MRVGRLIVRAAKRRQHGFTYLMLLAVIAIVGAGVASTAPLLAGEAQRDQEKLLLRVGEEYARAILSYYESSPGTLRKYPPDLKSLLQDRRYMVPKRHLRKLYADPLLPTRPWGLILAEDGGVRGVYSLDERRPWHTAALQTEVLDLPAARAYAQWRFTPRVAS